VTLATVLAALLAAACVVAVALPYLREPEPDSDVLAEPDAAERERLELAEERDRALAALKELEFDHRAGKITDEDYRAQVGALRRDVAAALRALESVSAGRTGVRGGDHRGGAVDASAGDGSDVSLASAAPPASVAAPGAARDPLAGSTPPSSG
jgi:hypothetical protein